MEYVFYSNELAHFGILGMKWAFADSRIQMER